MDEALKSHVHCNHSFKRQSTICSILRKLVELELNDQEEGV